YRVNRETDQVAHAMADAMLHGHEAKGVERAAWSRVRVGMTMHEVELLLGEAPSKRSRQNEKGTDDQRWWEYGYVSSTLAPVPDNRAYVIYFDADGRVASVREPVL